MKKSKQSWRQKQRLAEKELKITFRGYTELYVNTSDGKRKQEFMALKRSGSEETDGGNHVTT